MKRSLDAEGRMSFFDHLDELRSRIVKALWGILPGVGIVWWQKENVLDLLLRPLAIAYKNQNMGMAKVHMLNPIDQVAAYVKLSVVGGLLIASPWIFWQLWGFISPGLHSREKKFALPFVFASTLCFVGGAVFGYLVVFPYGFETLLSFSGMLPSHNVVIEPTITIEEYLSFTTQMLIAFGVVFEVPVVVSFLSIAGIVTWRQLLSFGRWWVLIAAVISAVLTPSPDIASQMVMLVPMVVLYFAAVGIAFLFGKKDSRIAPASAPATK